MVLLLVFVAAVVLAINRNNTAQGEAFDLPSFVPPPFYYISAVKKISVEENDDARQKLGAPVVSPHQSHLDDPSPFDDL
jgi:hypothetical protein